MISELSVIIPLYNSKKYINSLFENLCKQTYKNFMVYFVDDGSTDSTTIITSKLVKNDDRFLLLKKDNGGPSSARNFGLINAIKDKSSYILFIDSDDSVENDYFEKMVRLINTHDVDIVFASHFFNNKPKKIPFATDMIMDSFSTLCLILNDDVITSQSHHKVFKKKVWNNVFFPENTYFLEDTATIYKTIMNSEKCLISNYCGYHYNVSNNDSITKRTITNEYIICGWRSLYSIISNDFSMYKPDQIKIINKKAKSLFMDNFLELYPRTYKPNENEKREINFFFKYAKKKNCVLSFECKNRRQAIKKITFFLMPHLYKPLFRLFLFLKK